MLFEDTDISRRSAVVDERLVLISTGDFLRVLEPAGLIQSAAYVLAQAAERGRGVERQLAAGEDANTRQRLRQQLSHR